MLLRIMQALVMLPIRETGSNMLLSGTVTLHPANDPPDKGKQWGHKDPAQNRFSLIIHKDCGHVFQGSVGPGRSDIKL